MDGRDPPRALAGAELVRGGGKDELRVDQDVAEPHVPIRIGKKIDLPFAPGVLDRRRRGRQPVEILPVSGPPVQLFELLRERARGLVLQHREDPLDPRKLVGVQVHHVTARRQCRVPERLQVVAHAADDGVDQIACRAPGGLGLGGIGLGSHDQARGGARAAR
jgi:hypothetical protein